jgi:ATP-dependent Zn protease
MTDRAALPHRHGPGGRAAEAVVFQDISTGAHNDLSKATDIARGMVKEYGMDDALGRVYLESERRAQFMNIPGIAQERQYSEATAREIDESVRRIMEDQYARAKAILTERRPGPGRRRALLLEKEKILGGGNWGEIMRRQRVRGQSSPAGHGRGFAAAPNAGRNDG